MLLGIKRSVCMCDQTSTLKQKVTPYRKSTPESKMSYIRQFMLNKKD